MNPLKPKQGLMTIDCDTIRQLRAERKQHVAIDQINAFRDSILRSRKVTKREIMHQERERAYVMGICTRCFFRPRIKKGRWCEQCKKEKNACALNNRKKNNEYAARYRAGFIIYD